MGNYTKYKFSAISIKQATASRFRSFAKELCLSNTETLVAILDFFEVHQLSPLDSIDGSFSSLEITIKKRISGMIAIIKDIEKNQTKPTNAMLQSLFIEKLEQEEEEEPELVEKKFADNRADKETKEHTVPKIRYDRLEEKIQVVKNDFGYLLENIKTVKGSFGKSYLKLEASPEEIERFKRSLKKN